MTRDVRPFRYLLANTITNWRPTLLVLLPFAFGYYLSYLFRTVNALISTRLVSDLGLGAADLGFLTSVYFLTFAAMQLPLGILLDRYGPRRVQSALLLVAAAGAALFGMAHGFWLLVLARGLIGLGVAGALIAGLKAIVFWFPKERIPLVNGFYVMLGALGAVTATAPAELLLAWTDWRGLFTLLAILTAGCAFGIFVVVPDAQKTPAQRTIGFTGLKIVFRDPRFWRLAPISATCIGTAWALQGLWAAPFMADVERLPHSAIVDHLFVMAVALSLGALLLGVCSDRLRRDFSPKIILATTGAAFVSAEILLIARAPIPSFALWAVIASVGAATVLSYAILAEYYPKEIAGQANAALNLFHIGGAFVFQSAFGLILEEWPSNGGHYPLAAYETALGLLITIQIVALVWFAGREVSAVSEIISCLHSPSLPMKIERPRPLEPGDQPL
jgi:MFS family permease